MTMSGTGNGQGVTGFIANADNPFDPVNDGYPPANPASGFTARDEGFAGIIFGKPASPANAPTLNLYCFDILTNTNVGINYKLGTWNASNVPNVNYVAQVLNNFFPKTNEPANLTNLNQKAAAVQAAIWFFSDRYVLNTSDTTLRPTVVNIVNEVIAKGPAEPPTAPTVNITPTTISGTGAVLGPFTVTATGPATTASVVAIGANMFSDAAGTVPIAPNTVVASGTQIFLRRAGPDPAAVLEATAVATVPQNNVYLWDGTNPGHDDAQRLILAESSTLTTTVSANALFTETGSLIVQKTIAGPAAGSQGAVTIIVRCGDTPGVIVGDPFVIPARTPAGTTSKTYDNIPVGTKCTVSEIHDGRTSTVNVTVSGSGHQVTIGTEPKTVTITDTYEFVNSGALVVKKSIQGTAAGQQGEVVISVTCAGTALPPFTIPAGTMGEPSKTYPGLAPGTSCTVTETVDGHTTTVSVTVLGSPQTVTVPGGSSVDAVVTDTYSIVPGSLTVTKTITGPAAGQQGPITITVSCNENGTVTQLPDFTIAAGATGSPSKTYPNIPAGSICTAIETVNGDTSSVTTTITGDNGTPVTVPAAGNATRQITDTYEFLPGQLIVQKTITGNGAGLQGQVTIHTVCNGIALVPDLVVPAGTPAGTTAHTYTDIAAPGTCTVKETANGANNEVTVVITGGGPVTVPAGGSATSTVTNTYTQNPGSLTVNKTIAGNGAGLQGPIRITVTCVHDGTTTTLEPLITIPPGATIVVPHTYTGIPAGSVCTPIEDPDGSNGQVAVAVDGSGVPVTIPPGGTATADIVNTYTTGALIVNKTITGPAAGQQGEVIVHTVCNPAADTPDLVVPVGADPGTYTRMYQVAAGATCTVTETADGSSNTVNVVTTIDGSPVTITAGGATVDVTDTYTSAPGSLTVTKTIDGPAAGSQGEITIHVDCGADVPIPDITIPAGATAPPPVTIPNIPAGTSCTVTETQDGSTPTVVVDVDPETQTVTIPAGGTADAAITDTYSLRPGSLLVTKTIDGPAAGRQGQITIHVECDGIALTPDFVIDAGATGTHTHTYDPVPAGAVCTVTEPGNGSSATVSVVTVISPPVTIPPGGPETADVADTYTLVPGSLTVTKAIEGPSAGAQGEIIIGVTCGDLVLPEFIIPAGATGPQSKTYPDLPAGLTCTVTEEADGASSTLDVVTTGSPQDVTIEANTEATVTVTDTYGPAPGSLDVHKTINGPLAGSQGAITITVTCGDTTLPTWTIPAGTGATTLTNTFTDIPGGAVCTITETSDGATSTIIATVAGANQSVTVPAGTVASVSITDTYSPAPGALRVVKMLTGEGAGQQGQVGILVSCGGSIQLFAFLIPAGQPGGSVAQVFNGIGGGSTCRVDEVVDGHTSSLTVTATGAHQQVTVPAAEVASAHMTDEFGFAAIAQPPLAATGPFAPIAPLLGFALAALLAGAGITFAGRRRHS